ncbi:MAG: hypothetical protein AAF645_11465 [Myxococcota bacterium]
MGARNMGARNMGARCTIVRGGRRAVLAALVAAFGGCGAQSGDATPPATNAPDVSYYPCGMRFNGRALEVPIARGYALAASDGACLLIDESRPETFISFNKMSEDADGFERVSADLRDYLATSGVLGPAPRFTGRSEGQIGELPAETHTFVSNPPGLSESVGAAVVHRGGAAHLVVLVFADDRAAVARLVALVRRVRLQ